MSDEKMVPVYIADQALMAELQVMPCASGLALAGSLLAVVAGIAIGGFWIILFCLIGLILMALAYYTFGRGMEARDMAHAHYVASMLSEALSPSLKEQEEGN